MTADSPVPVVEGRPPLNALPDDALVALAQQRDVDAFEELLSRYEERVYRLAMRFARNESDAQEILQEAFLSAWRNIGKFEGRAQFGSWIYRVTVNAALMLLRTQRRHPQVAMEEVDPEALGEAAFQAGFALGAGTDWSKRPDEQLQSAELRRHLQRAVEGLPEILRTVFLVRDVDGLSTEETAELLDVSVPTVKTRLHRARLALRAAITAYFSEPGGGQAGPV